jgi:hypothetical protein
MALLSLQLKNTMTLLLGVSTSVLAGASVRAFYQGSALRGLVVAALFAITGQIALILLPSKEEEELAVFREARLNRNRQRQREEEEVSNHIVAQIKTGNFESVERWQEIRKTFYDQ